MLNLDCTTDQLHQGAPEPSTRNAYLSEKAEMWLMRGEGQHDEISIQAIQAVPGVGVPALSPPLLPDHVHDLVLPLSWSI